MMVMMMCVCVCVEEVLGGREPKNAESNRRANKKRHK